MRTNHLLECVFPEVGRKCAIGSFCECEHLVEHAIDQSTYADFLDQLSVVGCFEYNTGWMESDWTVER
jgi:hypothetical protein